MYKITSIEYNAKQKNRYFEQFDIIQTTCIGNFNKMDMKKGVFHRYKIRNNENGRRFDRNKLKPPENGSCFIKANESWHFSFVNLTVKSSDDPVVFNQSSQANCKFKLNFKNLHNSGYVRNILIKRCIHSRIFCFCLFIHANLFDLHRDLRTEGEEKNITKTTPFTIHRWMF